MEKTIRTILADMWEIRHSHHPGSHSESLKITDGHWYAWVAVGDADNSSTGELHLTPALAEGFCKAIKAATDEPVTDEWVENYLKQILFRSFRQRTNKGFFLCLAGMLLLGIFILIGAGAEIDASTEMKLLVYGLTVLFAAAIVLIIGYFARRSGTLAAWEKAGKSNADLVCHSLMHISGLDKKPRQQK